jgi:hypothetical protein
MNLQGQFAGLRHIFEALDSALLRPLYLRTRSRQPLQALNLRVCGNVPGFPVFCCASRLFDFHDQAREGVAGGDDEIVILATKRERQ